MQYTYKGYTFEINGSVGLWRWFITITPQGILNNPLVSPKYHATKGATKLSAEFFIDRMVQA